MTIANRTTNQRIKAWTGPAILSFGFRPFFLLAGIWAALAMLLWVGMLTGGLALPTVFDPISWHAHEMIFGYLGAVVAGFLMTAIPNWTGRMPIVGWPLAALVAVWIAGRIAVAVSASAPGTAAAIDLAFPLVLVAALGREIVAGRNWRNLPVVGLVALFALANLLFHIEAIRGGYPAAGVGLRIALAAAIVLISLIGGRVVPSFTRNWLAQRQSATLPTPFGTGDKVVMALAILALLIWIAAPEWPVTGAALALAGIAHLWRLLRWAGLHAGAEPLVWVLHVAYAFVPLGFLAMAAAAFGWIQPAAGQHIWMAGAIGLMTLAIMTRASLGHTGRTLTASSATTAIYLALIGSVLARLAYGFWPGQMGLVHLAAGLWILAFGGFAVAYWPVLVRPRVAKKAVSGQRP